MTRLISSNDMGRFFCAEHIRQLAEMGVGNDLAAQTAGSAGDSRTYVYFRAGSDVCRIE